jgi:hypothetical protein
MTTNRSLSAPYSNRFSNSTEFFIEAGLRLIFFTLSLNSGTTKIMLIGNHLPGDA